MKRNEWSTIFLRVSSKMVGFGEQCAFKTKVAIDLNRLRRLPVTQGKHSVKRSPYKALHKGLSLGLRENLPAKLVTDIFYNVSDFAI